MPETNLNCLKLNGSPSDYIDLADVTKLEIVNSSFTAEAWIKGDNFPANGDSPVLTTDAEISSSRTLTLLIRNRHAFLGFYANDTTGETELEVGRWYHVAWRYDREKKEQAIFIDGQLDKISTEHGEFQGKGSIHLGIWLQNRHFIGSIAEVRIWKAVRSQSDIAATMHKRLIGNEPGLVGYWRLDGNADDSQTNGNPNNGMLKGGTWVSDPGLKISDPPPLSAPNDPALPSGMNMEIVVAAILTDLAAAQNLANEFSQQLGQKHPGSFTVPNVVLKEIELDLRFVLEKIVKPASGVPNANILVDLDTLQALPPEFISSLRLQSQLDRYGWKMK